MNLKRFCCLSFLSIMLSLHASIVMGKGGPTPVFVAVAENKFFTDDVEAIGTLKSQHNIELTSTVLERVTKINFKDGQRVKEGDLLLEMDAAEELAEKAEEISKIEEARSQMNRLEPLVKVGAASASLLDEQNRELKTAEARLAAIESRITQRQITAPFDGVLGLRDISVGALVQPGTLITTLDDDTVMKLDFSVPEVYLATLEEGIKIVATARAYPEESFVGTIAGVDSRIDPVTRSIEVRALLPNDYKKLKPGLLMQVVLKKNPRTTLVIPEGALVPNGDQNFVLVPVKKGEILTVERRAVDLGARRKGEVEILSGIEEGDQVITHGTLRVRPGAPIEVKAVEKDGQQLTDLLDQG